MKNNLIKVGHISSEGTWESTAIGYDIEGRTIPLTQETNKNDINILEGSSRQNVVKIRLIKCANGTKFYIQICVGSNIARNLGWVDGDQVQVESNSIRKFVLLKKIDKSKDECYQTKGYIFRKINKSYSYSIKLPCECFNENFTLRVVDHEIIEENGNMFLKVYLNGKE